VRHSAALASSVPSRTSSCGTTRAEEQVPRRPARGSSHAARRLKLVMNARADETRLAKLRQGVAAGDGSARDRPCRLLALRADARSVEELRSRADDEDRSAKDRLGRLLAVRGTDSSIADFAKGQTPGDRSAQKRLADVLGARGDAESVGDLRCRAVSVIDPRSAGSPICYLRGATTRRFVNCAHAFDQDLAGDNCCVSTGPMPWKGRLRSRAGY
jgi:hypothetical protein